MFFEFLKLELRSAFKSPMVYVFFFLIGLLAFGAVASDNIQIGGSIGNIHKNAPFVLTTFTLILGIFGILFAAAFFNNAALRDHNNHFNEILFHLPIKKSGYFWGRFLGALILSTIPLIGVFVGAWLAAIIAPAVGWIEPNRVGPFYFKTLVNNYFIFILPNMFLAGSIIFFLAQKFKSTIISFVGAMGIIVAYIASGTFLSDIDSRHVAALVDMFGVRTYNIFTQYFTPIEKNTLSPQFTGVILQNRVIWIGVGILVSIWSYARFSFREKLRYKKRKRKIDKIETPPVAAALPQVHVRFGKKLGWIQFKSFFLANFRSITKSIVFKILAAFGIILLFTSLVSGYEYFGLQAYPVTYKVIDDISESTSIFMMIVIVFFSGELVWRDRISHIEEVINATAHSSFVSIFAKVASLVSVAIILQFIFIFMGIMAQLLRGYFQIELDIYLIDFFVDTLPAYIIFAALFVLILTLVSNRYIGYFIGIIVVFIWSFILNALDWSSNMLQPGASPGIFYSAMSGFGPGMTGTLWFDAYWIITALLLVFIAGVFWPRSTVSGFKEKWKAAFSNFNPKLRWGFGILLVCWILVAGFVFYNTQILNPYKNSEDRKLARVSYENKYKKYSDLALPVITDVKYEIDIFPKKRDVYVKANVHLVNKSAESIDSLFFNIDDNWNTEIKMEGAEIVLNDSVLSTRIYQLAAPLSPGDTMHIKFATSYVTKGFQNGLGNTNILKNGTFLNNLAILPVMGYSRQLEISNPNDREKYGLPPRPRMPKLEENCTTDCMKNYLTNGRADWVNAETIISTSSDQMAIAPGSLIEQWEEDGRNYYHYKLDHASQYFFNFMSARYEVARDSFNGTTIEIYYDQKHGKNIPKMITAVKHALAYYEENFGPYYHEQARILEFPRYSTFAQAFPGTMPYSESFGFITNLEDENDNNVVGAVIAHEMAHQWWAHQEIPALMQGATMLTESFAEYSSLMVMKKANEGDPIKMKNFLKYDFDRYLRGRTREIKKELPLYKVENQSYIHYGKGSVILYALQDYIGEDKVNRAMRNFLEKYRYASPPYPTTLNFLDYLKPVVPDSLQYLITDWFKKITLYDFRLKSATAVKKPNGKYAVTFVIDSRKLYADSIGNETEQPLHEWVDIGVYADDDEKILQKWKRIHITEPRTEFTLLTDSLPVKAAVDPRRMLIERIIDDNVVPVELKN